VNSVAPGFILLNPATMRRWTACGEASQRALVAGIATRRLGTPEDIAQAVLFLASDYAAYSNGQTLSVDGGK
jgi:3-oxoacyl-[acyl-carrier protein] reductase